MHYTLEEVVKGNSGIVRYYSTAQRQWQQILHETEPLTVANLAKRLSTDQLWFERNCGGRELGQEVMVVSGIAQFYSTADGFGENYDTALLVTKAFSSSFCSVEVKSHARHVAQSYDVVGDDE